MAEPTRLLIAVPPMPHPAYRGNHSAITHKNRINRLIPLLSDFAPILRIKQRLSAFAGPHQLNTG